MQQYINWLYALDVQNEVRGFTLFLYFQVKGDFDDFKDDYGIEHDG